jgi:hypothetical protein
VTLTENGKAKTGTIVEAANEQEAARQAVAIWKLPTHKLGTQLYVSAQKFHKNFSSAKSLGL